MGALAAGAAGSGRPGLAEFASQLLRRPSHPIARKDSQPQHARQAITEFHGKAEMLWQSH